LGIVDRKTKIREAFKIADSVLYQATKGISDLINHHGIINLDFADIKTIMKDMGEAIMGTGLASGEERAILAAQQAISSPLLDDMSIKGANGLLINITGSEDMNLFEVDEACQIITEEAGKEADIIFGAVIDENLTDEIMITVIATGFGSKPNSRNEKINSMKIPTNQEEFEAQKIALNYFPENIYEDKINIKPPLKFAYEENIEEDYSQNGSDIPAYIRKKMNK
ncbi:MAG: cell division protein FtsZ, partial [Candidatus Marinimicrobia bacterium]|nr:cell division protein FtsZ [Candidatus Neomarinimicrobiota bacterium]